MLGNARTKRTGIHPAARLPREGLITAIKEVLSRRAPDIDTPRAAPSLPPSLPLALCFINILLLSEDTAVRQRRPFLPPLPLDRCGSSVENRPVDLSRDPLEPCPTPSHPFHRPSPRHVLRPRRVRGTRLVFRAAERLAGRRAFGPLPRRAAISRGERGARNGRSLSLSLASLCSVGHRESSRSGDLRSSTRERLSQLSHPRFLLSGRGSGQERRLNRVWPTSRTRITEEFGRPVADHYPKTTFVSFAGGRSR